VLMSRQPNIERVLRRHIAALGGTIERGCELVDLREDPDGVVATVADAATEQRHTLHAAYLIGCDGGHSQVRRLLGLNFAGEMTPPHLVLGDRELAWDQPPATVMWLHEDGVIIGGQFPGSAMRAGHEYGDPGRLQPRLEAGAGCPRQSACDLARH